jgi:hypothetical protein
VGLGQIAKHVGVPRGDRARGPWRVFVIDDGRDTAVAIRMANALGQGLDAEIVLIAAVEVPLPLPLDEPPVSIPFLENKLRDAMVAGGASGRVELRLCRDRDDAVRSSLPFESLVVLSGRKARGLARLLASDGHKVFLTGEGRRS